MAKAVKTGNTKRVLNDTACKGTSIGRGMIKLSSMNKHTKRSYKKYRGQGK